MVPGSSIAATVDAVPGPVTASSGCARERRGIGHLAVAESTGGSGWV